MARTHPQLTGSTSILSHHGAGLCIEGGDTADRPLYMAGNIHSCLSLSREGYLASCADPEVAKLCFLFCFILLICSK